MIDWREFATKNNLSLDEFENEIIDAAQALLAIRLVRHGEESLSLINGQNDGVYELTFKRIIK